ncbi:hypothetical protein ZWY2020_035424 [Hordeum vulgare]|nr:hypothetical protein ZWY2020_035424 [Hordeum vulgare]
MRRETESNPGMADETRTSPVTRHDGAAQRRQALTKLHASAAVPRRASRVAKGYAQGTGTASQPCDADGPRRDAKASATVWSGVHGNSAGCGKACLPLLPQTESRSGSDSTGRARARARQKAACMRPHGTEHAISE